MNADLKKALVIGGGLIALYLAVYYSSGAGTDIASFGKAGSHLVRTFQGR